MRFCGKSAAFLLRGFVLRENRGRPGGWEEKKSKREQTMTFLFFAQ